MSKDKIPHRPKRGKSLVIIDNPDDVEFGKELGPKGDDDTLVGIDNPDDAEYADPRQKRRFENKTDR